MKLKLALVVVCGLMLSSCATIFGDKYQTIKVNSKPIGAHYSIINTESQIVIKQGITPDSFQLPKASGFYSPIQYSLVLTKEGYKQVSIDLKTKHNGLVFGNLIFLNIFGLLVDGINSNNMYKIVPNKINVNLNK